MMPTLPLPAIPIAFARPQALLLLVLAVAFLLIRRWSLRGLTRGRDRLVLALRLVVLVLLVASLAGPLALNSPDSSAVAFLVDVSESVTPEQRRQAAEWLRRALAGKGPHDQAEVIAFAGEALIEQPLGPDGVSPDLASTPRADQTDLAAAIRLALGTLPQGVARKIVVLSDGAENAGNALAEARLAEAAGVPISFVPLAGRQGPETLLRQIETPSTLHERDTFSVRVTVEANVATAARLHLLVDGRLDSTHDLHLKEGANSFEVAHAPLPRGFHSFQAQLEAPADTMAENNRGASFTMVLGRAKVLLVEGVLGQARFLSAALQAGGLEVAVSSPTNLPADATRLRDFDGVVLVNVPVERLAAGQVQAIKTYVQSFGGGLAVVGGDQSYGAGGYGGSPLEEMLPVSMDIQGRRAQSGVALILVIDTSGSMGLGPAGATKIDLAKKAALDAVSLLGPQDQLGILAFEDRNRWVVEPTFLDDPVAVKGGIATLAPGGGTEIYPALKEAYEAMAQLRAKVRHIILMTDGVAPGGDYDGLTAQLRQENISLSTIAIGVGADLGLLQRLAEQGNGRYYEGLDPYDVPQITVKETREVSRAAIVEQDVKPVRAGASPILEGLDLGQLPPLGGYVATTEKPLSTTVLASPAGDPLLVEWQYGLGQVVAWTSDAENRWAADWLTWPRFSQFWTQLVKRTISSHLDRNLHVSIQPDGQRARIVVDSLADDGSFLNFQRGEATVVDPQGNRQSATLQQTAPGRYEGFFALGGEGAYAVEVTQRGEDGSLFAAQTTGFVAPYSSEYRNLAGNVGLLRTLAEQTGGRELASPAQSFRHEERLRGGERELWPFLVGTAVVLFVVDVGARRLRIGVTDVERAWRRGRDWWRRRGHPAGRPAAERLVAAKRRLHDEVASRQQRGPAGERPANVVSNVVWRSGPRSAEKAEERREAAAAAGARLLAAKKRAGRDD